MANALGPFVEADGDARIPSPWMQNPQTGYAYRVDTVVGAADATQFLQRRPAPAAGLPDHERELLIDYRIGAGVHDLSLVLRDGAAWRFAPLEYFREHGWQPAPQELGPRPPGFRHGISKDCLVCHSPDRPPVAYPEDALGDFRPGPIGCAVCHGDGREHVRRMRQGGFVADSGILHPRDLSPTRQLDLCARCHLEGDARLDRGDGLRLPAAGSDLLAGRAVLVARKPEADLRFVSQVRRLALSACFQQSPEMSCTSCHDPHLPARLQGRDAMIAACLRCHDSIQAHGQDAWQPVVPAERPVDCLDCHMPQRRPLDLLKASISDHWIRVIAEEPPAPGPMRFLESPVGNWVPFRYRELDGGPDKAESRALVALGRAALLPSQASLDGLSQLPVHRHLPQENLIRGILEAQLGQLTTAEHFLRLARSKDPNDPKSGVELASVLIAQGTAAQLQEAQRLLEELRGLYPLAAAPWRLEFLLAAQGQDTTGAQAALEASISLNPDQAILWQKLGRLHRSEGREEEALGAFRKAYRWDADLPGLSLDLRSGHSD